MLAVVNEIFIRFVSNNYQVAILSELSDSLCFVRREDDSTRILRSVVIDGSCSLG